MKLDYIDALRGWAIILVLIVHNANYGYFGSLIYPSWFKASTDLGSFGVQLFFIVSAFTLARSYKFRRATERQHIRNFFIRRYFRIAPLYYLGILYFLWQDRLGPRWWTGYEMGIEPWIIASNFSFMNSLFPHSINSLVPGGWSISVEFIFYLSVPLLLSLIRNTETSLKFIAFSFVGGTIITAFFASAPAIENLALWNAYLSLYLPANFFVFGIGFLLFFISEDKNSLKSDQVLPYGGLILLFALWSPLTSHMIASLFFSGLFLIAQHFSPRLLVNNLIIGFGKISYSLYIVHCITLYWMSKFWQSNAAMLNVENALFTDYFLRFILLSVLSYLPALAMHKLVEKSGMEIGTKIIGYMNKKSQEKRPIYGSSNSVLNQSFAAVVENESQK